MKACLTSFELVTGRQATSDFNANTRAQSEPNETPLRNNAAGLGWAAMFLPLGMLASDQQSIWRWGRDVVRELARAHPLPR
eukprot:753038-Amphidinium_carterae.1